MRTIAAATIATLLLLPACGGSSGATPLPLLLTAVAPAYGTSLGGTALTLQGAGFSSGTLVEIGGRAASSVVVLGEGLLTCEAPPGVAGATVDVVVQSSSGRYALPRAFSYHRTPAISSVAPATGFAPGGTLLAIEGSGFEANDAGACTVHVGGVEAPGMAVGRDDELTCTAPPGLPGAKDVSVSNENGVGTLPDAFTAYAFPPSFPTQDVRLDTDTAGAGDATGVASCSDGDRVYVAWVDLRDGLGDIYFNRSLDGGATWLAGDIRLDTDAPGAATSTALHMSCDESLVCVVWHDDRSGLRDVYLNRSADAGSTWLAQDVRMPTNGEGGSDSVWPRVACGGSSVHVVWRDARDGDWDVYTRRSLDAGLSWPQGEVRLDSGTAGAFGSIYHRVVSCPPYVYVTWYDYRNGPKADIYFQRSLDDGASWLAGDVRLDTDAAGAGHSYRAEVCCDADRVYVTWRDDRSGAYDIRFNRSLDAGTTWLGTDVRLDTDAPGVGESDSPRIACDGTHVYVVWSDGRSGQGDLYLNRSTDAGGSWLVADVRLDTDAAGASASTVPDVSCCGANVFVAWADTRSGQRDIRLNASLDRGATWLPGDLRLDTDTPGSADSTPVQLDCDGARVRATWLDDRVGPGRDVRFTHSIP